MTRSDLIYELRKDTVDHYIDDLLVELDKLAIFYQYDSALSSQHKAEVLREMMEYVTVTKYGKIEPPKEEIPPRGEEIPE